jgi:phage terminase large subunit
MAPAKTKSTTTANLSALAEKLLGVKLNRHQRLMLRSIMRNRRTAVASCHAAGKSYALACAAIGWSLLYDDARVVIVTPGWITNRRTIWAEIHALLARARMQVPVLSQTQTELRLGPRNLIIGLSASDAGRLQGHHSEHLLVIIDEAPAIDPEFWPSVEGLLAGGDSRLVISGNPTVTSGPFYDAFSRNRASWECIVISAFDTENLAGVSLERLLAMGDAELDDNPWPFLITRRWVRERHGEWFNGSPENSPLWQGRVLGQFPTESSNALIPLRALEAARRPATDSGADVIVGVDVAGPGRDRTVATVTAAGAILETFVTSAPDARGEIVALLKRWQGRLRVAKIDSAGNGWYFLEYIRERGFRAEGINVGSAAAERERFSNLKAERYWHLREAFLRGAVSGLSDETLAELTAVNWVVEPNGRTSIEDKASVKSALGRSPDLAESLMLALGEPEARGHGIELAPAKIWTDRWQPRAAKPKDGCEEQDMIDDAAGDATHWFHGSTSDLFSGGGGPRGTSAYTTTPTTSRRWGRGRGW